MVEREPVTDLGPFSSDGAVATEWATALADLQGAEVYWLSTVRPDGRPHVTPLLGVWLDGALYFCTGPGERKAKNLAQNPNCALTTGCNGLDDGLDLVVEGAVQVVSEGAELEASPTPSRRSMVGVSRHPTAPGSVSVRPSEAVTPWCTGSARRRRSGSARAGSSARLGGVSPDKSRPLHSPEGARWAMTHQATVSDHCGRTLAARVWTAREAAEGVLAG